MYNATARPFHELQHHRSASHRTVNGGSWSKTKPRNIQEALAQDGAYGPLTCRLTRVLQTEAATSQRGG